MLRTLLTTATFAAFLAMSPALAQETMSPGQTAPPAGASETQSPGAATAVQPKFIAQQKDKDVLASQLIGAAVYNASDENLGSINDLVLAEDGSLDAVVIGVGGFLGIGQKSVAIAFDAIDKTTDADGNVKLVLAATSEELDAADAFVTLAELRRQQELDAQPAPGMAPAPQPSM